MKFFLIITVISAGIAFTAPGYAYYTITLNNGEELQAEDYKFEGEKISLKLKTGTAAFPKMLVRTITGTGAQGSVNIDTLTAPVQSQPAQQPTQAAQPQPSQPVRPAQPLTAPPQAGEIPDADEGEEPFPPDEEGEEEVIFPEDEDFESEEGLDEELDLEGTE